VLLALVVAACSRPAKSWRAEAEDRAALSRGTIAAIEQLLEESPDRAVIPAGAFLLRAGGQPVMHHCWGEARTAAGAPAPVDLDTLFDVASLTKPMAGAAVALAALGDDRTDPALRARVAAILTHRTGLDDSAFAREFPPAHGVYTPVPEALAALRGQPLRPAAGYRYSNLAWAALPTLVDNSNAAAQWSVAGIAGITWHPAPHDAIANAHRDAIGNPADPFDPTAHYLRDAAGLLPVHSGLFASANGVADWADRLLVPDGEGRAAFAAWLLGVPTLHPRDASAPGDPVALSPGGLEAPLHAPFARPGQPAGRFFMQHGYTGCWLWIDRHQGLVAVLLTNASQRRVEDAAHRLTAALAGTITPRLASTAELKSRP
jgi:CubicO group peptidase (beta-lactamase class C family)